MFDFAEVNTSTEEDKLITAIAQRAVADFEGLDFMTISMDLTATHSITPLDLTKLLEADNFNFRHDVAGIFNHIDRVTGKLTNCFVPRSTK